MPKPGCKPKGGFAQDAQEQGQQLGSGHSSPAPAALLGSSRWSSRKSPHKPGKGTNLLEDKSVGKEGEAQRFAFSSLFWQMPAASAMPIRIPRG